MNEQKSLIYHGVILDKITYKSRFESTVLLIQSRLFTRCQIKHIIQQLSTLCKNKTNYFVFDTMFALCFTLLSKRQRATEGLTRSRLFALTYSVCPRTSSPSQATCLLQYIVAHFLQQNGRLYETLYILSDNLRRTDLDTVSTFNCHMLLDLIDVLRRVFEDRNDYRFLDTMLTHICEGFVQLKTINSTYGDDLTEGFRKNATYCVSKKAIRQLPKDSAFLPNMNLLEAILKGDVSECRLAIDRRANVNVCLHALLKTIKLSKHIAHLGNDLYSHCSSSVVQRQNKIIKYLLTSEVDEFTIEQGISVLYVDDSRRNTLLDGICILLQKEPGRLNLDEGTCPVKIQHGRRCNKDDVKNCFLVHVNVYRTIDDNWFAGFLVIFRNADQVSSEGMEVELSQLKIDNPLSDLDNKLIKDILEEHGEHLWSTYSNLNVISACPVKSFKGGAKLERRSCIVLYCSFKGFIPYNEPQFPTSLSIKTSQYPVDVREGRFHLGGLGELKRATQFLDPLIMGGSVGLSDRNFKGSIGPFIPLPDNETGFITCAHVFFDITLMPPQTFGQKVDQPNTCEIEDIPNGYVRQCGTIFDAKFDCLSSTGIDIALVKIAHRNPKIGSFAFGDKDQIKDAGFDINDPPTFNSGSVITDITSEHDRWRIIKSGCKTGLTKGKLKCRWTQVLIKYNEGTKTEKRHILKNLYEVHSEKVDMFLQRGDSGSGVFLVDEQNQLHCIGIAVGCTEKGAAMVIPIGPVLKFFNLPGLKQF